MPSFSRNEIVLVRFPFSDLSKSKVRPGVVVSVASSSKDIFVIPLTSQTVNLLAGEFLLSDWAGAGLNVPTAVKRGIFSIHQRLILKSVGFLSANDSAELNNSLRSWMELIQDTSARPVRSGDAK